MSKKDDRHSALIKYLNAHTLVKTSDLLSELNIKKSTLSEDLKELKEKDYPINTSVHGYVSIEKNYDSLDYYGIVSKKDIRKWLLLYAFNLAIATDGGPISTSDIFNYIERIQNNYPGKSLSLSKQVLYEDINELYNDGYLTMPKHMDDSLFHEKTFHTTTLTPRMLIISEKAATRFLKYLSTEPDNILYQDMKSRIYEAFPNIKASKETFIQSSAIKFISDFIQTKYKHKCLNIKYQAGNKPFTHYNFETGLIMYSAEKNRFFILGRCDAYKKEGKTYKLLRADKIIKVTETEVTNNLFMSEEIIDLYEYIFEASLEKDENPDPVSVELLIENSAQNINRIELLCESRYGLADYKIIENPEEKYDFPIKIDTTNGIIKYTDTVLGTTDLLPFIRFLGNNVQIVTPLTLENTIMSQRPIFKTMYEEIYLQQYGEDISCNTNKH